MDKRVQNNAEEIRVLWAFLRQETRVLKASLRKLQLDNIELAKYISLKGDPDVVTVHAKKHFVIDALKEFEGDTEARKGGLPPNALYYTPDGIVHVVMPTSSFSG